MHAGSFTALRGRYVFPIVGPPIERGVVTLHGDRIIAVGKASDVEPIDLGNVAILPGLVNAHTHLEFSQLTQPLGEPGEPLPTWIRRVIAARIADPEARQRAVECGFDQSLAAGVTAIGEISTSASAPIAPATTTLFHEVICLDRLKFDDAEERLERLKEQSSGRPAAAGVSPHAPYSVHPELLGPLCDWARRADWPVAMHLAESPEEMELLNTGGGLMRDMLQVLGVWRDDANPEGLRPLHYLRVLADAPRALIVHGNYLNSEERAFVAARPERMAVVYCPRTHAYFGHAPYPLYQFWSSGATVCIGTDSRASNPDLNLLEDLKFAATHHPAVPPREILRMGTLNSARMLNSKEKFGALEPGRRADLAVVSLPDGDAADPHELLFSRETRVQETWYGGQRAWKRA